MRQRRVRFLHAAAALVLAAPLTLPASAAATFHGRNGLVAWSVWSAGGGGGGGFNQLETVALRNAATHVLFSCAEDNSGNVCTDWGNVAYSPGGTRLLWDDPLGTTARQLTDASADGGDPHQLLPGVVSSAEGSFSPDGHRVVFVQTPPGADYASGTLAVATLADGSVRTVPTPMNAFAPVFTPDGRRIVFGHDRGYPQFPTIWSTGVDGRHSHRLLSNVTAFDLSPNGRLIAYTGASSGALFLARIDGSHRRRLLRPLDGSDGIDAVRFSPDGRQLVFSDQANNSSDGESLYTVSIHGGRVHEIAASGDTRAVTTGLAWQG